MLDTFLSVTFILVLLVLVPVAILFLIDVSREEGSHSSGGRKFAARTGKVVRIILGGTSVVVGTVCLVWVFYNRFIERLPEFKDSSLLPSLGIGPLLIATGYAWLRNIKSTDLHEEE